MESLQSRLPSTYYAQSSQRVWLEYTHRQIEPDVEVVRSPGKPRRRRQGGGVALAEVEAKQPVVVRVETTEHGPFKESYLEVRRREGKKIRIVTSIEVLSPSNKAKGNPGREQYLAKQKEVLSGRDASRRDRPASGRNPHVRGTEGPCGDEGGTVRLPRLDSPVRSTTGLSDLSDPDGRAAAGHRHPAPAR